MKLLFPKPLVPGKLIKRYKRFLADVTLETGEIVVAHCTNSGSMKSCIEEGAEVYLTHVNDPKRKTQYTWEMIKINGNWIGINTMMPNMIAHEWVKKGIIPGFEKFTNFRREVTYDDSRFDIMAENDKERCFIEVKNVTMKEGDFARFPDAKTTRGQKHLQTLIKVKENGMRAVMLYIIQRTDVDTFAPAWDIDPIYGKLLVEAHAAGVEIIAFQVKVSPEGFSPMGIMPVDLAH
ncbi:MAG: DNA/RNA nuclease SfsA [Salinivirgaceae bacterium]|nr:DNA/RNA nuclease SfsA [Salinivirgaceae bacterium]MDD4747678.1 DNA/RNA nuclease SfsA [Salinivirgaceae bacterium]MDY0281762.1 DNA/RNA nuclease SfsA [Salinivirgaceae bacterium]